MDLVVFSAVTLLVTGAFVALRAVRLAAGRWWRWVGTAASVLCGAALVAAAVLVLEPAALVMAYRAAGLEPDALAATGRDLWLSGAKPEPSALARAGVAAVQDFWRRGTVFFAVLGVVQGAALGLALSVVTEPHIPSVIAVSRLQAWRDALGKAVVMLPLPAALAVLLTFYQDNRERFSAVGVGSFLTLALNPPPTSGSQHSAPEGGSGGSFLYATGTFVSRAQESLNGNLRGRDLAFVSALKHLGREARVPTEEDFEQTSFVERWHCDWLQDLRSYVEIFDDYNLFTLDIGEALSKLQIAWEVEARELDRWVEAVKLHGLRMPIDTVNWVSRHDSLHHLGMSKGIFEGVNRRAQHALIQIGAAGTYEHRTREPRCGQPRQDTPASPSAGRKQEGAYFEGPPSPPRPSEGGGGAGPLQRETGQGSPRSDGAGPPPWTADQTRSRVVDLHAPYRAIGTANFYAAIGSFETAYKVLRDWLALDARLRQVHSDLNDALPRWFRLRVLQEALEMYQSTSPNVRSSERYRRTLEEVVQEYRGLVQELPSERGNGRCPETPAASARPAVGVDPVAALGLARVTSEIEFFEVSGLSGAASQRHVEDARALTRLDLNCFIGAFHPMTQREEVRAELRLYEARAVVAWGRLAIRWAEAGKVLKRVSDTDRKTALEEVRVAVGGVVERLEHRARIEDEQRLGRIASKPRNGGARAHDEGVSTLDHARVARRVLQEALALDQ